jgi:DNA repair ATPase RecN
MWDKLQPILQKLQPIEPLILICGVLLVGVLLAIALVRQRRMGEIVNVVTANFANLRNKLDEAVTKQKSQIDDSLGGVRKQLQQALDNQQRDATAAGDLRHRVDELGTALRDMGYQIQESFATSNQNDTARQAVADMRERLEELIEELSWTNNWFADLKALENAVINLVGPGKMRKLIDKERSISQAAGEEFVKKSGL